MTILTSNNIINSRQNRLFGIDPSDSIYYLDEIPERIKNYLKKAGIYQIKDLANVTYNQLLNIYGIGSDSIKILMDIKNKLLNFPSYSPSVEIENENNEYNSNIEINKLSVEILELPKKTENALINAGIITLGDFLNYPIEKFIKLKSIGIGSVKIFIELRRKLKEKPELIIPELNLDLQVNKKNSCKNLDLTYEKIIEIIKTASGDKRGEEIISRRYGLFSGEYQTLEEIGHHFKITRERVRQIESKILRKLRHPSRRIYFSTLSYNIFSNNDYLISDDEADNLVPKILNNSGIDGSSLFDLLSSIGLIQSYKKGDFKIYSSGISVNQVALEEISEKIISVIKDANWGLNTLQILNKVDFISKIDNKLINPEKFILKYCRLDPRIEEKEGINQTTDKNNESLINFRYYLTSHHATEAWSELMVKVLKEENSPLHFTEITNKVNDLIGDSNRILDIRRAHSILIENNIFAHSGVRGTYGLTEWGFSKSSTAELVEECLYKAGFPLHWKQIYNYVSKYKDTKPINILAILNSHVKFDRKNKGIYGFKKNVNPL